MQAVVGKVLETLGHKHEIDLQYQEGVTIYSWANPSTIPNFAELMQGVRQHPEHLLPHQVLPKDQWPDEKKRKLVLAKVSRHFHLGRAKS